MPKDRTPRERRLVCVVGARPNFMKMAPIVRALQQQERFSPVLVHTGQHYDEQMSDAFFRDLGLPRPDINLGVGSGSHPVQMAEIMKGFEGVLEQIPDALGTLVVGDVNSTLACALVSVKRGQKVIHVEAGLRSFDRKMPEEINRVLTDQISDLLLTTEPEAEENLRREGIAAETIHFVGNAMIDSLLANLERAVPASETLAKKGAQRIPSRGFALVTLHRPSNVDDTAVLERLLRCLVEVADHLPVVFPVHPRTLGKICAENLMPIIDRTEIVVLPPVSYLSMLGLMKDARLVLTDSGGVQEETTALGVPCLTLRHNTERPITVEQGTNLIVGTDPAAIVSAVDDILTTGGKAGRCPDLWDGRAAERIVDVLNRML